ncbi:MAG: SUMF1/EgtB/PvdO family nonheme iron enzyme [Planctomycetota bacterium]
MLARTAALIAAVAIAYSLLGCQSTPNQALNESESEPGLFTERLTVPITQTRVAFDMVRMPGDEARAIEPFYISRHEVTWQMIYDWMYCQDLEDQQEAWALIDEGLRPSPLQEILAITFQVGDNNQTHPAMGMTRLTAQGYCIWLSEQTGRRYRLPTLAEWRHAAQLGGGLPIDSFDKHVLHAGNAEVHELTANRQTLPAGSKQPNAMGIYDLFGSVAEWVTNPGGPDLIVGGSINTPPAEISAHWQTEENIDIWSASYPNLPYSRFWYMDYYFTGIRLICEPASVVANPPEDRTAD